MRDYTESSIAWWGANINGTALIYWLVLDTASPRAINVHCLSGGAEFLHCPLREQVIDTFGWRLFIQWFVVAAHQVTEHPPGILIN